MVFDSERLTSVAVEEPDGMDPLWVEKFAGQLGIAAEVSGCLSLNVVRSRCRRLTCSGPVSLGPLAFGDQPRLSLMRARFFR